MTCPVCLSSLVKVMARPKALAPSKLRCVGCDFGIIFKGLERPEARVYSPKKKKVA